MFPNLLHFFWLLLQATTAFSLIVPALFCLSYFILTYRKPASIFEEELHEEKDYAIVIPSFNKPEDIQPLLTSLQQLNYTNYIIYITGKPSLETLYTDRMVYLRNTRAFNSRGHFYRFVIENFNRPHTHLVVLEKHQLVDENYLTNLNTFFNQGYQVVKSSGVTVTNKKTGSFPQSVTAMYHNFFTGKMMFGLGSSATLSNSGIAFQVTFFKQCLKKIKGDDSVFTTALQTQIIKQGHQVAFAPRAVVYNSQLPGTKELLKRHAFRIHIWIVNLFPCCKATLKSLVRGNRNQFLFGVLSMRLPLPTSAVAAFACLIVNARIHPAIAFCWSGIVLLLPVYLMIATHQSAIDKNMALYNTDTSKESCESLPLYNEEEYSALMQTV